MELGFKLSPMLAQIDNLGTIELIKNIQVHSKTKNLDVKLHFIRYICGKDIAIEFVPSEENIADILTKNLLSKGKTGN